MTVLTRYTTFTNNTIELYLQTLKQYVIKKCGATVAKVHFGFLPNQRRQQNISSRSSSTITQNRSRSLEAQICLWKTNQRSLRDQKT